MIFVILLIFALPGFILGKYIFKNHFNPVSIYTMIWYGMLTLYHLKLIKYKDLSYETWIYVGGAYISLVLGSLTYHVMHNYFYNAEYVSKKSNKLKEIKLFADGGTSVKFIIILFSIIGLFSALQHWAVLIHKYGSLVGVLLKANEIYRLRIEGKLEGVIPYIHTFAYVAVFLAAIYTAYKNKFSFITFFPLIVVFLKELANVGRSNILMAIILFLTTYIIFKLFYRRNFGRQQKKIVRTTISLLLVLSIFIASSAFMRAFRGTVETFSGTSRALSSYKDNLIISPSIYLYLSSHLAVFNRYLALESEKSEFAQYTFQPIYNILSKTGFINKKVKFYHKGYFVPVWTNSGTYLREMHADFGIIGVLLIPYLLGVFSLKFWNNFFLTGSMISFVILVELIVIIFFSFFLIVTRFGVWYIHFLLLLIILPYLEKFAVFNKKNRWLKLQYI